MTHDTTAALGPFLLTSPLGAGGMGQVWRGVHVASALPVVIKTISPRLAHDPRFVRAFRAEVEAVARLNHPGVVTIHDYGQLAQPLTPPGTTTKTLDAGTPYMVMALAPGLPLHQRPAALDWPTLRHILAQLLDALAYAHARGVTHRDLKPPNIMFEPSTGQLQLIDFGIASLQHASADRLQGGTPTYMAPEQLLADFPWDDGPWTDLYALGCTAWELATGRPPRTAHTAREALDALLAPAPALVDPPHTPPGFARWIERLIAYEPADRFPCAADALWALSALADPTPHHPAPQPAAAPAWTSLNTLGCLDALGATHHQTPARPLAPQRDAPPLPPSWETSAPPNAHNAALANAGLGLFGLRAPALVGRTHERDLLWAALQAVHRTHQPRVVSLDGGPGVGKSTLAAWLCQRAHELGAATPILVTHSKRGAAEDGLPAALARMFGCAARDESLARARLAHRLSLQGVADPVEVELLWRAITPHNAQHARPDQPPQLRHGPLLRALARWAAQRPVILWLDDLQWGLDTQLLLDALLPFAHAHHLPILVLITTRDAEPDAPAWSTPAIERIPLDPLDHHAQRALIEQLIGLTGSLVDEVARRAEGNPLFAAQLIGDWVQRGVLVPDQRGFALAPGASSPVPATIEQIFLERLERAITDAAHDPRRADDTRRALHAAAALGRRVQRQEWEQTCALAGLQTDTPPLDALLDALLDTLCVRGLALREPQGWQFAHGMICETLEHHLRAADLWPALSRAAAQMLQQRYGQRTIEAISRTCAHMLDALDFDDAFELLRLGVSRTTRAQSHALLSRAEQVLGPPAQRSPAHQAQLDFIHGLTALVTGDLDDAAAPLQRAELAFTALHDPRMLLFTRAKLAWLRFYAGELDQARQLATEALAQPVIAQEHEASTNLLRLMANIECFAHHPRQALAYGLDAISSADRYDQTWDAAWSRYETAMIYMDLGPDHYIKARALLEDALERMEGMGERIGVASCHLLSGSLWSNNLELEASSPAWQAALTDFERALALLEPLEDPGRLVARENLGRAALALGQDARAREHLEVVAEAFERPDELGLFAGFVYDALIVACLATDDQPGWERAVERCERRDPDRHPLEMFNLLTFRHAERVARARGLDRLAQRLEALADATALELTQHAEHEETP